VKSGHIDGNPSAEHPNRVAPRPVFCVYEDHHHDRALADEVCDGRFTHNGETLELGLEPDWTVEPHPDKEWRIDWSKFYYGLDLASAFVDTGDAKYVEAFVRLTRTFIEQVPVDRDTSDVTARRISNWMYAWMVFERSPAFSGFGAEFEALLLEGLRESTWWIHEHLTEERNHRTLELYCTFVVSLALPAIDPGGKLLHRSVAELGRDMEVSLYPDGVHYECSTHYHMVVLRSYVALLENARRYDVALPAGVDEHVERACEFAMHAHRPDGQIPAFSDADTGNYFDILDLAADLLGRDDFRYVAAWGREGTAPRVRNASFPAGGYFTQRSGWGDDGEPIAQARYLLFDCGPIGAGGHGHYDALSVECAAHGRPLVMDPGRYTYSEHGDENWRAWFKGTRAHNTVTVDGLDQTPYKRGKPYRRTIAAATFLGRHAIDALDLLAGEVHSPAYPSVHRRRILFVNGDYWIVIDDVGDPDPAASDEHDHDLRWHLAPQPASDLSVRAGDGVTCVDGLGVTLALVGPGTLRIEDGWIAPLYGVREPAPVVSYAARAAHVRFATLVAPVADHARRPAFAISFPGHDQVRFEIDHAGGADTVEWSLASPGGHVSWSRDDHAGTIRRAELAT